MKFNKKTRDKILEAVRQGNFLVTSAAAAGISKATLYAWMRRGESVEPIDKEYAAFLAELTMARAQAETEALRTVLTASHDSWQAAAWYLERSFPQRWGRNRVEDEKADAPPRPPRLIIPGSDVGSDGRPRIERPNGPLIPPRQIGGPSDN